MRSHSKLEIVILIVLPLILLIMTTAKTAISLESTLLEQTDKLAKETGNSRSGIIAIALQKYFSELEQQKIL